MRVVAVVAVLAIVACGKGADEDNNAAKDDAAPATAKPALDAASTTTVGTFADRIAGQSGGGTTSAPVKSKEPGFYATYRETFNDKHKPLRDLFMQQRFLETIADVLGAMLVVPRPLEMEMKDCGNVNAWYDESTTTLIVCYEMLRHVLLKLEAVSPENELALRFVGTTFFVFFHEMGHALADVLDLPLVGKQEDAVDQLATVIMVLAGDIAVHAAMKGAEWFKLQSADETASGSSVPFWDDHSMSLQRFYNVACLVYGSNPTQFASLATDGTIPAKRAARCQREWERASSSWLELLAPHWREKP